MHKRIINLFIFLMFSLQLQLYCQENHAVAIVTEILSTKQAIINASGKTEEQFIFLAFWDFDGTILKGDCSEGLYENNLPVYKGLARLAIELGYSEIYSPQEAGLFIDDYRHLEENIGRWFAYPFIPQMLRGCGVSYINKLAEQQFNEVFKNYYFNSSIQILNQLEKNGIENHIISASADLFVDAAAASLNLPKQRFNGIEVIIEDGLVTEKLKYPVTWNNGKTQKLQSIVERKISENPGKDVFVIAAFGNSYSTDGPFMKYIAEIKLPGGRTKAVMINGGETPGKYKNLFDRVEQNEIVREN